MPSKMAPPNMTNGSRDTPVQAMPAGSWGLNANKLQSLMTNSTTRERTEKARNYLNQHEVLGWVQGMLQGLIRDCPEDPWMYIEQQAVLQRKIQMNKAALKNFDAARFFNSCKEWVIAHNDELVHLVPPLRVKTAKEVMPFSTEQAQVQSNLRATLLKGFRDGTLVNALNKLAEQSQKDKAAVVMSQTYTTARKLQAITGMDYEDALMATSAEEETSLEELRTQARISLFRAGANGQLMKALRDVKQKKMEDQELKTLRDAARDTLVTAARSGELDHALQAAREKGDVISMARDSLMRGLQEGRLADAILRAKAGEVDSPAPATLHEEEEEDDDDEPVDTQELCQTLRVAFLKASQNGSLFAALSAVKNGEASEEAEDDEESDDDDDMSLEELRQYARDSLIQAADSGELQAALKMVTSERSESSNSLDQLRVRLQDTLLAASHSGALQDALREAHETPDIDDVDYLRRHLSTTLMRACRSGRLEKTLFSVQQEQAHEEDEAEDLDDLDDLRDLARDTMLTACHDGRLEDALRQCKLAKERQNDPCETIDEIRLAARECILSAFGDGRLEQALRRQFEAKEQAQAEEDEGGEDEESFGLRKLARDTLLRAATDGRLVAAFHSTRSAQAKLEEEDDEDSEDEEEDDIADLRKLARDTMIGAATTGRLVAALRSTRAAKASVENDDDIVDVHRDADAEDIDFQCEEEEDDIDFLRGLAKETLLNAMRTGELPSTVDKAMAADEDEETDDEDDEVENLDDLRSLIRHTMVEASKTGKLEQALAAIKKEEAEADEVDEDIDDLSSLRMSVRDSLLIALKNGSLQTALQKTTPTGQQELRKKAAHALIQSNKTGQLQAALHNRMAKPQAQEPERMRTIVRDSLIEATRSGALSGAFENLSKKREEEASMKMMQDSIHTAAMNGKFASLYQEWREEQNVEAQQPSSVPAMSAPSLKETVLRENERLRAENMNMVINKKAQFHLSGFDKVAEMRAANDRLRSDLTKMVGEEPWSSRTTSCGDMTSRSFGSSLFTGRSGAGAFGQMSSRLGPLAD